MKKLIILVFFVSFFSSIAQIPTSGLIAYYPFNGNANDESGNSHNATVYNAILTSDRFDASSRAYYFDGDGDYIDLGDWEMGGPISICVWVKYTNYNNWSRVFQFASGIDSQWYYDVIYLLNSDYNPHASFGIYQGTSGTVGASVSYNDCFSMSSWVFVVLTAQSTTMTIFRNGNLVSTNASGLEPLSVTRTHQYLGRQNMSWDQWFNGSIDDLRIYNRVLSDAEILSLYNEPLPVELNSFLGCVSQNDVILKWQTATEVNNYGFNIERKTRMEEWKQISFVQGHGNSNSPKEYSFTDEFPPSGKVEYRLRQIDFDGKFSYSNVIEVNLELPTKIVLEQNHPNPFNPTTKIGFEIPSSRLVKLSVYDVLGREVKSLVNGYQHGGSHEIDFNATGLSSGVYFYSLISGQTSITRKLMLLQ